jgi:membrane protease YdiL (CAAX protease family)
VALPVCLLALARKLIRLQYAHVGFTDRPLNVKLVWISRWSLICFIGILASSAIAFGFFVVAVRPAPEQLLNPYAGVLGLQGVARVVGVSYLAISAGFLEEVFYRAVPLLLLSSLTRICSRWAYVAITSALFAFAHAGIGRIVMQFGVGVFLGLIYLHIRDIRPLIVGHTAADLLLLS